MRMLPSSMQQSPLSLKLDASVARWEPIVLVDGPVSLFRPDDVETFSATVTKMFASTDGVRLVVFDTLARCMGGGVENNNDGEGMGLVVAAADTIRRATGAQVLLVHHSGKGLNTTSPRGGYALTCGVDTQIKVAPKKDSTVTLTCEKQLDADEFDTITLTKQTIAFADGASSVVLVKPKQPAILLQSAASQIRSITAAPSAQQTRRRKKHVSAEDVLSFLHSASGPIAPVDVSERFDILPSAAQRHLKRLTARGSVATIGRGKYVLASQLAA
jgi:hypothetical protein